MPGRRIFQTEGSTGAQYLRQRFAFERPALLEQCLSWRVGGDKVQDMLELGGVRAGNTEACKFSQSSP